MKVLKGKYSEAKIFASDIETEAESQVQKLLDSEITKNCQVAIMPDVHVGKGSTIGYTQTISNKIMPCTIGVDIGCGVAVLKIKAETGDRIFNSKNDLKFLDSTFRSKIPMGNSCRKTVHDFYKTSLEKKLQELIAPVNLERAAVSVGTLGGGNHFGELDKDEEGNYYFVIHTGSRHLGLEVCEYWQAKAEQFIGSKEKSFKKRSKEIIQFLRKENRETEISDAIAKLKIEYQTQKDLEELAYIEGKDLEDYLHDMSIAQKFAEINREAIQSEICKNLKIKDSDILENFCTVHNYIDLDRRIIRKGAIRLEKDEIAIIPGSMAFGSLIVKGKGNSDWNYSGPHGFGRKYSRSKARQLISMEDFKESMKGIFSSSVVKDTIDESPMSYKSPESIIPTLEATCKIELHIKPVWNIKSSK